MAEPQGHSERIIDAIGPPQGGRKRDQPTPAAVKLVGLGLIATTSALVVAGPHIMSIPIFTALELLAVLAGAGFGIYLAAHSRTTNVDLERAYSAHLEELSRQLREKAYRDALTGLYNHRYFYEQLSHEVERSIRYGQPLSVLLMDMNNFKEINDRYGHFVGDKFLSLVGEVISRQIRASDIGARYGGDEFVVILPNTPTDEARLTAAKLESAVAAAAKSAGTDDVNVGIAIGLAACPDDARSPGELLQIADSRLYDAKAKVKRSPRYRGRLGGADVA